MSGKTKTILVGYSGHAYVIGETAQMLGIELAGYFEQKEKAHNPFKIQYLGSEQDVDILMANLHYKNVSLGIGDNSIRERLFFQLSDFGYEALTICHHDASISKSASVGAGTFIARGVLINPLAAFGRGCIVNTGAIIEHECTIGDFVHIAPGAVLAGNVSVGNNAFVGANAVVKQGVKIGANSIVGAGAVVLKDIPDQTTYAGNPATALKL